MSLPNGGASGGPRSRIWVAAIAVLLLVFVAGGAAGSVVRDHLRRASPSRDDARGRGGRGGPDAAGRRRDPIDRLGLSADERARVDSVVSRRRAQIEAFWAGPGQQLRTIMDSMHSEMRAQMTPEHRTAFDSMPDPRRRGDRDGDRRDRRGPGDSSAGR